jgi:transcriptional regulator with XRE-family HTH domain
MPYGLPWSEQFVAQLEDDELRDEFVADQVRTRITQLIRTLREQRGWNQTELANQMRTTQSVVSRMESPDYGKANLQTLLEVAAAFKLPLWVDIPEWEDWFRLNSSGISSERLQRRSFDSARLKATARTASQAVAYGTVARLYPDFSSSMIPPYIKPPPAPTESAWTFDLAQPFLPQESASPPVTNADFSDMEKKAA